MNLAQTLSYLNEDVIVLIREYAYPSHKQLIKQLCNEVNTIRNISKNSAWKVINHENNYPHIDYDLLHPKRQLWFDDFVDNGFQFGVFFIHKNKINLEEIK